MTENYASGFTFVPGDEEYPKPQDLRNAIFNDDGNPDVDETTVKYGMVNIKVQESGPATVIYHGSSLVDAPHRPVIYEDIVMASKDKIISYEFEPKAKILNPDAFEQNRNILRYELTGPKNEPLFFIGDICVSRTLQRKQGNIGLHIPYYTRYLMVNIDISAAQFIQNGKAIFINGDSKDFPPITQTFNKLSMTYSLSIRNVPRSDLIFTWKSDEEENE